MKTAVIVASRTPALLDLHLRSHRLWTPERAWTFVVVDTSPDASVAQCLEGECAAPRGSRVIVLTPQPGDLYSAWCHAGARVAREEGADLLVFANDDTVVTPDWLGTMETDLDTMIEAGKDPGILGACSNCISGPQSCVGNGGRRGNGVIPAKKPDGSVAWVAFAGPVPRPLVFTQFAAVLTEAYFAAGGFDLDLPTHYGADDALAYRMTTAGYTNAISRAFVCHFGSATFLADGGPDAQEDRRRAAAWLDEHYPDRWKVFGARP